MTSAQGNSEAPAKIRRIVLSGSPEERGHCHGESFRDEIRAYAEDRVALCASGSWSGRSSQRDSVLALAETMRPAHRAYSEELNTEMEAMARASGLTPAEAIIAGGFTDFVDALRDLEDDVPEEDDCTAVLVPESRGNGQSYLAQTWDMHDSATEHVVLLDVQPTEGLRSFVFSTVGCLGQIGINEAGICVGINNLSAAQGTRGVTWPTVIRQVLKQNDLEKALECILRAPLAGAHHYLLMNATGQGYDVEAMPQCHAVRRLEDTPLVHTNHCLDATTHAHEAKKAPALLDSSERRLLRAQDLLKREPIDVAFLMDLTRDAEAICQISKPPYHIESSGAAIMRPGTGELWAVAGLPSENQYERFEFDA